MNTHLYSKYGRVFDLLPEMIFILDGDLSIVDGNTSAASKFSDARSGRFPKLIEEIVVRDQWPAIADALRARASSPKCESRFSTREGSVIDVAVQVRPLESSGSTYTVVIAKDITDDKKRDLEYLQFSNVIKYTKNPIQITDAKGIMVYVNPAFEKASGYRKEELIGKNPKILNSGRYSREFWSTVWKDILSGRVWVGEIENRRKDGLPFHSELVISPIEDAAGNVVGFLGAHRDITEQKVLLQQLIRSQKMESIGTLAAGIAHEVGNPLTSISSLVQVIHRTTS
ncbi:MAG: PAS domain S-box protein, partial [Bacteroidota bacterium]